MARSQDHDASPAAPQFRHRAVVEAQRYGADPWIFVRELLQNARDAGATRVEFKLHETTEYTQLSCSDDGEGMAFEHARAYLFSLYASSKEQSGNQVGRFGVGFWSILRYEPTKITIRSRPRNGQANEAWAIQLDGRLERARATRHRAAAGTQIILERGPGDGLDAQRLLDAARQNGRFLTQRDAPSRPLDIVVNDTTINAPFTLSPPSAHFSAQGMRGVVALGQSPGVELFARGLRVRTAASLDDLLSSRQSATHSRVRFAELPDALAPRALLDCEGLELLLNRSDVRDDKALRRLVSLAHRHLRKLVEQQLALVHPPGIWERLEDLWHRLAELSTAMRTIGAAALGALIAFGLARWMDQPSTPAPPSIVVASSDDASNSTSQSAIEDSPTYLRDLRQAYAGPSVQTLDTEVAPRLELRYWPTKTKLHIRLFSVSDLTLVRPSATELVGPYRGVDCDASSECVQFEVALNTAAGMQFEDQFWISLPEATGYLIDPDSIEIIDTNRTKAPALAHQLRVDTHGEAWLGIRGEHVGGIRYRLGPGIAEPDPDARNRVAHPEIEAWATPFRQRSSSIESRLKGLTASVAERIRYSTSADTARAHRLAIEASTPLINRSLAIGAGDCDIQNSILAILLRELGISARLAVGYVGQDGSVPRSLHAWVEYRSSRKKPWSILDASTLRPPVQDAEPQASPDDGTTFPSSEAATSTGGPTQNNSNPPSDRNSLSRPGATSYAWLSDIRTWLAGFFVLVLAAVIARLRHPRADAMRLARAHQLPAIVQGALRQPETFRQLPGLFRRRIVPTLDGRLCSLEQIQTALREGRVHIASAPHDMAQKALSLGDFVLDRRQPVAQAVIQTLGLSNLDHWQDLWEQRDETALLRRANAYLRRFGIRVWVGASRQVQGRPVLLSFGSSLGTLNLHWNQPIWHRWLLRQEHPLSDELRKAEHLLFFAHDDPHWRRLEETSAHRSQSALFALLDRIAEQTELDPELHTALLTHAASRLIEEAAQ